VFSNHKGYVFHDSKGIESGGIEELEILKDFIRRKCGEKSLRNKLHAIWFGPSIFTNTTADNHVLRYCVSMDNRRPGLDLKFYDNICSDPNGASFRTFITILTRHFEVPVIALFTKYDQFLFNVEMDVWDDPEKYPGSVPEEAQKRFQEHYLRPLGNDARYVRLESEFRLIHWCYMLTTCLVEMHMKESHCDGLIEETAAALNEDVVALMFLAVQRGNLELSVKTALSR
jgi:hypothetical protein